VLAPLQGPRLILFRVESSPVVALRLSFPVPERPGEAGAGRALLHAALDRAAPLARQVGARVEGSRTLHGISLTVSGTAADLDHLAWILRQALREPDLAELRTALDRLRGEVERDQETPAGLLQTRLRETVAPGTPPLYGSPASVAALTPSRVLELRSRVVRREHITVVVAGSIPVEVALAALQDVGLAGDPPAETPEPPPGAVAPRPPRAQVLRQWYGEAYPTGPDDPSAAVAARLMAGALQDRTGRLETWVELWELGGRGALVVTGAAYPGDAAALRDRIRGLRGRVAAGLTEEAVSAAVNGLRRETLLAARHPTGLAELVGYHLDATDDPSGTRIFLERLEAIRPADVAAFLADGAPLTAEVRP